MLQQAVTGGAVPLEQAERSLRWAAAVAGYGQLLRGDPYLEGGFGWREVADLASRSRDADVDGLEAEFIHLARLAESGRSVTWRKPARSIMPAKRLVKLSSGPNTRLERTMAALGKAERTADSPAALDLP